MGETFTMSKSGFAWIEGEKNSQKTN